MKHLNITLIIILLLTLSCKQHHTPLPRGYMKVDFPVKTYQQSETSAPFSFEYPGYAKLIPDTSENAEKFWYNLHFPVFDGTIYISYKEVQNNLESFVADSRKLAYKHSIKAETIEESIINRKEAGVYGILYDLSGNTASSIQFFLTDSSRHFLRGSLYFNATPEKDSLAPVIEFVREDVLHLIETFNWNQKNNFKTIR